MSERAGARFIHDRVDPKLQLSSPVIHTQEQRERAGLETSQKPAIRLSNWFEVLERTHLARGASAERQAKHEQVMERIKNSYHNLFVIKPEDIPESYFALEVRIAREQGDGNIPPYDEYKQQKTKEAIEAQKSSLDRWIDYLTSEDADAAGYPMWARYWAFMSVTKMGLMEKKTIPPKEPGGEETIEIIFGKRDEHTAAPFPNVNSKALAKTFEAMQKHLEQQGLPKAERRIDNTSKVLSDAQFAQMLSEGSFAKLYGQFLAENPSISVETLKETRGEWVRYKQGSDATELFESLQDHTLEWCTAGAVNTAQRQVDGGDFYVYYSLDDFGEPTIPRIAIRKEGNHIAEIRGIEHNQNLDPYIGGVLQEKLEDEQAFPNAEEYLQGVEDMQRVTDIENKMGAKYKDIEADFLGYDNPGAELSEEDLEFIYQLDRDIVSLGYGEDPRINQICENRNFMKDLVALYGETDQKEIVDAMLEHEDYYFLANNIFSFDELDHNQIAQQLIDKGEAEAVTDNLDKFHDLDYNQIAQQLIDKGQGESVAENLYEFLDLDNTTAQKLIEAGQAEAVAHHLYKFPDLERNTELAMKLIESGVGYDVADNLDKFQGLDHNQIAQQLIDKGEAEAVADNLDKFQGLDHNQIAQQLIDKGQAEAVARNLFNFQGLDHNQIAQQIIDTHQAKAVARNLHFFNGLDNTIAQKLIDIGEADEVIRYLENFQGLDHNQIAQQLIDKGQGKSVAENLDKFQGLDSNQIFINLFESGQGNTAKAHYGKFLNSGLTLEALRNLDDRGFIRIWGGQSRRGSPPRFEII